MRILNNLKNDLSEWEFRKENSSDVPLIWIKRENTEYCKSIFLSINC